MYVSGWRKIEGSFQRRMPAFVLEKALNPATFVPGSWLPWLILFSMLMKRSQSGLVYEIFLAMLMLKLWKSLCR